MDTLETLPLHVTAAAAAAQAHKCPQLARMQLKLIGPAAVGMCCQKVSKFRQPVGYCPVIHFVEPHPQICMCAVARTPCAISKLRRLALGLCCIATAPVNRT